MSLLEEQKVKEYLEKEYANVFDRHRPEPEPVKGDFRIWFFWLQGWDAMPRLVRRCWENLNRRAGSGKVCFIDRTNFRSYISLPSRVLQLFEAGTLGVQHFSDVLRFALLNEYGGLWVDATVFVTDDLENHQEIFRSPFFSIRFDHEATECISGNRWMTFFQGTNLKNNPLYAIGCDIFYEYLKSHAGFETYLFQDIMIACIYENCPFVRNEIDALPRAGSSDDVYFILKHFNEEGNRATAEERGQQWLVQKLSWKWKIDKGVPSSYINMLLSTGMQSLFSGEEVSVKVTVVIPVYNSEKYLRECLDSVVGQTLREIEVICVDDGSSDGSIPVLEEYAAKDGRVRILRQEHKGAGAARNLGMSKAKGKYLSFLDSDDRFELDMLEKMYAEAETLGTDILVCHADRFQDASGEKFGCTNLITGMLPKQRPFSADEVELNFFECFMWWAWDKLYLRSFVEGTGLRFQEIWSTEDLFFSAATMLKAKRISYVEDVLVHQRARRGSLSQTLGKSWNGVYQALSALGRFLKEEGLYEDRRQDFVNYCVNFSLWHMEALPEESSRKLVSLYREKGCEELGLLGHGAYYFYRPKEYLRFLEKVAVYSEARGHEVGYNFLYPLSRILAGCHPRSILEFHLGRVTRTTAEYAAKERAQHLVLESRSKEEVTRRILEWGMPLSRTELKGDILLQASRSGEVGVAYQHFAEIAGNRRYDLVLMTCPPGVDAIPHMDLLPLLPGILKDDFAVLMDHAESRHGKRVLQDMTEILQNHSVPFVREEFRDGDGTACLLVSEAWQKGMGFRERVRSAKGKVAVSVIVPVYNAAPYLAECLDSILAQDFPSMEILCVDDGSTDGSREILEAYCKRDRRIRILAYGGNRGVSHARNCGIAAASGEYLWFVDSDDYIKAGAVKKLYSHARDLDLDCVLFDAEEVWEGKPEQISARKRNLGDDSISYGKDVLYRILVRDGCIYGTVWQQFWRREFLQENHLRFLEGIEYEDGLFSYQAVHAASRVCCLEEPCYVWRHHSHSITTAKLSFKNAVDAGILYAELGRWLREKVLDRCAPFIYRDREVYFYRVALVCRKLGVPREADLPFLRDPLHAGTLRALIARYCSMEYRRSAEIVVPVLVSLVPVDTVVDVGCGFGTWLSVLKEHGATVLGMDRERFYAAFLHVEPSEYIVVDFDRDLPPASRRFSLVVSLGTAWKLSAGRAAAFVRDLCRLGDVVLFSGARPGQAGTGRADGQPESDWGALFFREGYVPLDCIRPAVREQGEVEPHLRESMLLYVRKDKLGNYPKLLDFFREH